MKGKTMLGGIAALLGFVSVLLLAIGSHGVADAVASERVQLIGMLWLGHAAVLLLIALQLPRQHITGWAMLTGLLVFAAGVLGRALWGIQWPVPVAPIGGLILMGAWLWLSVMLFRQGRTRI